MSSSDERFVRTWQRWHGRGIVPYTLVYSSLTTSGLLAAIFLGHNFAEYGWKFAEWQFLDERELWVSGAWMVGTILAYPITYLDREDHFQRLHGKVP